MTASTPAAPLRLYYHPMSRARNVLWMLEECEAECELIPLDFATTMKSPDYLAINPMGQVPALVDGDTVVTELLAILAHLADKYPHKRLAPAVGSAERGAYYRWLFFAAGAAEAVSARAFGWLGDAAQWRSPATGFADFDRVIATLEQAVDRAEQGDGCLCGGRFSAADLFMAGFLQWGAMVDALPRRDVFDAYVRRHTARPAALRVQGQ